MFVKPKPGLKVRDEISKMHIPESGKDVPESSYWMRRLRSGDVVLVSGDVVLTRQIPDSSVNESDDEG